jgi:diguanylate cyclase (GGDEF)-like protein
VAPVHDADGIVTNFVASQYDVTAFKNHENKLSYLAHHDELTSLPNRAFLRHLLLQAIGSAKRHNGQIWLMFIDLDRFKTIIDSLGHSGGDAILQIISDRLLNASRESDIVARWGGDEFVVVVREQPSSTLALAALQRMMAAIKNPIPFRDQEFSVSCSMGVSRYPQDSDNVDTLLDCADIAAYYVKRNGGDDFSFHTDHMNELAVRRLKTEADLRGAIERDEFILHYQAQVDLTSGRAIGVEALIRWNHPERGLLYPCDFIAIAEETGLITSIDAWTLRAACRQNKEWQIAGLPRVRMAVNLSARQFAQHNLGDSIALILAEVGLSATDLEIELTESLIMDDVEEAITVLRDIKALGVTISVDDFGTGYSSLSYLKRLPLDVLKIDRSFVSDLDTGGDDATAIVTSIITLAHALKLKVIAEGVETAGQLNYLRNSGCDQMQGYYFGRPIIAAEFAQLLYSDQHLVPNNAAIYGQANPAQLQ